jgi:D-alanyl-D-alanine carboxypeptidase (penicillin-binding protein 5/6)
MLNFRAFGFFVLATAFLAALSGLSGTTALAQVDTTAKHAIMIDMTTDSIILEKDADVPMPPASMSKLMTIFMVFERLKSGKLSLNDRFLVSRKAWRKGGSKMFVMVNTRVSVEELLRGIIIQSGNDACVVIAEGISGSEDAFAMLMTRRAKEIGLANSSFKNATGWPAEGHYMSARDIATLSIKLIRDFPEYYSIFAETEYTYGGIRQGNRNPLLYKGFGADGLKTGHTEASGYGLASSVERNGRRLVLVVNGLGSMRARSSESARLMDWGFRETASYALFKKGEEVDTADIWLGEAPQVKLLAGSDLVLTMPRSARRDMKVKAIYRNPVQAPVAAGAAIGRVQIVSPGRKTVEIPLVAANAVERLGPSGRIGAAVQYLIWGGSAR